MTAFDLAITFPEAKSRVSELCTEDRRKIRQYNDKISKARSWFALNSSPLLHTRDLELLGIMLSSFKQHRFKKGKVLNCEDRLSFNEKVFSFMNKKGHPEALNWQKKIETAKTYPLTDLLKFGNDGKALCPFHNEKTPSFKYYHKTNTAHCFGCSRSEDSIGIVQHKYQLSFKEAVIWLLSRM